MRTWSPCGHSAGALPNGAWQRPAPRAAAERQDVGRTTDAMETVSLATESRPGWPTVVATVGVVNGILPSVFGATLAEVASVVDGCGQFGDFGCGGFGAMGLDACPGGALGGAVVAGITASQMTRSASWHSRRNASERQYRCRTVRLHVS